VSGYTIGEIAIWLVLTAVLAFALGWMSRELVLRSRQRSTTVAPPDLVARPVAKPAPERAPDPARVPRLEPAPEIDTGPPATPGPHPGSALPLADGAAPSSEYVVKVSRGSKIYHAPSSPSYVRTTAAIWFTDAASAEAAGFRKPKNG